MAIGVAGICGRVFSRWLCCVCGDVLVGIGRDVWCVCLGTLRGVYVFVEGGFSVFVVVFVGGGCDVFVGFV